MTGEREDPRGEPGAIIRPDLAAPLIDVSRHHPRESLQPYVEYLWVVRWTVTSQHRQQVLPQPKIHLAAEDGRLLVNGINRDPFFRTFDTSAQAIGVAFRPAGFRPFLRSSVGALEGKVVPAGVLWPEDDAPVAARILAEADASVMVRGIEDYLDRLTPEPDPLVDEIAGIVERIEHDTAVHRVDQVASIAGVSARTLQRMFTEYVGIGPKWVIQRRRLLDAAERAHDGAPVNWAELADRLGFSDQAHLIRAFTATVGMPPAAYSRATAGWRPRG
ncbi:helix-turn-helix domain-containing protein [Antrihabitans cavernicola]|uniref:Helix-turn-helix transcriptional regulator n=1 Tax=Antrihabitans cavernicola TaxID=2495913 RepID=A0A5A7S9A0_9NOCA|nr:helix-turn-helix domain-containing protein [Spelaeibacter cavernicola]KAA0022720.1 helix-turn-helix transcriptional regulator [Spelaeibacter cavernicola]